MGLFDRFRRRKAVPPPPPAPPAQPWPPEPLSRSPDYVQFDTEPIDETPAWLKYPVTPRRGHVIVFANEKGGVGKSTSAFHTCIALCNAGERVAALDVDLRQLTLHRALWARMESATEYGVQLPGPEQIMLAQQNENELEEKLRMARIHQ